MRGRGEVRIIYKRNKRSLLWPLLAITVTGIAAAIWLDKDVPQQPGQLQVTAPPVAEPAISSSAVPPLVQNKPQTPPVLPTPAPMAAQPVVPQVKTEAAKVVPPIVPPVKPLTTGSEQLKNPAVIQQPAKLPAAIQPAVQPATTQPIVPQPTTLQPAAPSIKKEPAAATPVAEPLTESNTKTLTPAGNDHQYELIKMN